MTHPATGGRVVLELEAGGAERARYRVTLYSPAEAWTGSAEVAGDLAWGAFSPAPPPEWLLGWARAFLDGIRRAHERGEPWPARLSRWREERPPLG